MVHLLPVIMALILGGAATLATTELMSFSAKHSEDYKSSLVQQFRMFENALAEYSRENIAYVWVEDCPPDATEGTNDPSCIFDREIDPANDGSVTIATWQADLIPTYMFQPYFRDMASITANRDGDGTYLCFEIPFDDVTSRATQALLKHYGADSFAAGNACAVATSLTDAGVESYGGGTIFLTKWFNY